MNVGPTNALVKDVEQVAQALIAMRIAHGDRVGILAGNRAEWLLAHLAISSIGAISVWVKHMGYSARAGVPIRSRGREANIR